METRKPPFRLTRHFSATSLLGVLLLLPALFLYNRHHAYQGLIEHESRANVALTHAFANTVWASYEAFVPASRGLTRNELLAQPEIERLRADVLREMRGTSVAKVKLYNLDGLTVFSSDPKQIGEDKSGNDGFLRARRGEVVSQITFRDKFDAFEGVISERSLIASYIPVRTHADAAVQAVFEVYSDVTPLVAAMERAQWRVASGVAGGLLLLYLFLFYIVRRADGILLAQEQERATNEERIRHHAYHDPLTGLPNRRRFNEQLDEAVKLGKRTQRLFALLFLDLDRFKLVNDSLGHDAGDQLLKIVAKRIVSCARESDTVFRMGGDEFTVLLEDIKHPEDASYLARRIIDALSEPIRVREHDLSASTSIGITVFPTDDTSAEQLVKNADAAMYLAKAGGRGRYRFYSREINTRATERLQFESALQRALRNDEFVLHYQPRVETATGAVVAVEALLRWNHPDLGLLGPDRFIDLLEDTGLMIPVGEWVLRTACRQVKSWEARGLPPPRMSVNISARQLIAGNLADLVARTLAETALDATKLELELTETSLFQNTELASSVLDAVRKLGVRISIDDFGAGYSSFNYLRQFPIDYLKLDRSLVKDLAHSGKDKAIAGAVATLARALDIGLVAEGVEDPAQAEFLTAQQCQEMQGFLFGRPVPAEDLEAVLAGRVASGALTPKAVPALVP